MIRDLSVYDYIKKQDYDAVSGPDWPSYEQFKSHLNIQEFVYNELDTMLSVPTPFNDPAYCVLPFYATEYPQITPCCLLKDDVDLDQLKSNMLSGVRDPACQKCWNLEDVGIKSDRLIKNETLDFYFDRNLQSLFEESKNNKNSVVNYKIDGSNLCNATCVTCNSYFSSSWARLEEKNQYQSKKTWKFTAEQSDQLINYATAKHISFRGGESLLITRHFEILKKLLENNNNNCGISFVTNGSVKLNKYQKNIISKFKHVNFCFSIDGVGPVFEYLRFPLKWDDLLENIAYCRDNNIMASASYTLNNLNILYHDQTVDWFQKNNLNFITNPVYNPDYFSPSSLPITVKKQIMSNSPSTTFLLGQHSEVDDARYETAQQEILRQDQMKNIRIQDYLPELAQLLG
jgi:organic radical activating enzyme